MLTRAPAVYQSSRSVSDCAGPRGAGDPFADLAMMVYKLFLLSYLQVNVTTVIGRKDSANGPVRWGFRSLSPRSQAHLRGSPIR